MPHQHDRSTHRPVARQSAAFKEHTAVETRELEFSRRRCFVP